ASTHGRDQAARNHFSIDAERVESARGRVQAEDDAEPTPQHRARVRGDLMGHAVESAVGGLAARRQLRPNALPPLRGLRDPLRASHSSRGLPAETLTGRDGPVAPGDLAPSAPLADPLDPRLTKNTR